MTTTVTMLQTRRGEDGNPWLVDQSYSASDAFAAILITANYATGTLPIDRDLVPIMGQTNSAGQVTSLVDADGILYPLAGANQITADDTGSAWVRCPEVLSFAAVLASGTSTTVLLEVRDIAGTVTTAATILADVVAQTLRQAFVTREVKDFRFRRSSGTGVVTITY